MDKDGDDWNECTEAEKAAETEWLNDEGKTGDDLYDDDGNWLGCGLDYKLDGEKTNQNTGQIVLNGIPWFLVLIYALLEPAWLART